MKPAAVIRSAARWALIRLAHDATGSASDRSMLVVAPHPDDETLGCAARILRARAAGTAVAVLVIGDGGGSQGSTNVDVGALRERRTGELAVACERLGIPADRVRHLGYPDDSLAGCVTEITAHIVNAIREFGPDDIYVTCADEQHPDHTAAARASASAVAEFNSPPRLLEYPIWLWADWPVSRRFKNGSGLRCLAAVALRRSIEVVRVTDVGVAKRHALAAYGSQLGEIELPSDVADYRPTANSAALPASVVRRALDGPELFFRTR